MKSVLLISLLFFGCHGSVISTEKISDVYVNTVKESCHHTSFCFVCGMGFDGKFDCNYKFSYMCPGSRLIRQECQDFQITYEDGTKYNYSNCQTIEFLEVCN